MKKTEDTLPLQEQVLKECKAMARYAFASGLKVPGMAVHTIDTFSSTSDRSTSKTTDSASVENLVQAHECLSRIVSPATPRTILFLASSEAKGVFRFLGPVPFIRWMMVASILFLIAFLSISLSPNIDKQGPASDFCTLFFQQMFFISAAGLGASFSTLSQANHYIVGASFDPKYQAAYWIRFFLGLLAGVMLAQLIPIEGALRDYAKPTLAMVGGFSSSVVYKIINRLVYTIEALVQGKKAGVTAEPTSKASMDDKSVEERLKIAGELLELQRQITSGESPGQIQKGFTRLLSGLLPFKINDKSSMVSEKLASRTMLEKKMVNKKADRDKTDQQILRENQEESFEKSQKDIDQQVSAMLEPPTPQADPINVKSTLKNIPRPVATIRYAKVEESEDDDEDLFKK